MDVEAFREMKDYITSLQAQMRSQHRAVTALEQAPIPEPSSSRRPPPFHGYDSEDVNRWLDKMDNYLILRRIDLASPTAQAELVTNLAGPVEDFYYSLPTDQKSTYIELRDSLRERYANNNQSWIIWQAISTRQQGTMESLDIYLTDLTNKFRRVDISDGDKMRYFVQGLRPDVRKAVLLREPKTFREAEQMARLACSVETTMSSNPSRADVSNKLDSKLDNLSQAITLLAAKTNQPSPPVPKTSSPTNVAYLDGHSAVADNSISRSDLQQLQEMMKELLSREIKSQGYSTGKNTASLAAVSESSKLQDVLDEIRRIESRMEENIEQRNREMDAKLRSLEAEERFRSFRDGYTPSLATFSEPSKREARNYMREIHQMEHKFKELSRRVDARINGLARINFPYRDELPRQHTRREQHSTRRTPRRFPICYKCGRAGHIQYNCYNYNQPEDLHQNQDESTNSGLETDQKANFLRPNRKVQQKITAQPSNFSSLQKCDTNLSSSDLTTEGKIAGQYVQFLVDTGACVSAIDKEFFTKIYGQFPPKMSQGSISAVQTVSGDTVPVLGMITIPVFLKGREYPCKFRVIEHLIYDAILGRDFLQENRALIDLDTSSITFKGERRPVKQISSFMKTPVMGTFHPQSAQNVTGKKTDAQQAEPEKWRINLVSNPAQRNQKNKGLVFQQPLLVLMLILLYLFANLCTLHINYSNEPVIQKMSNSLAHVNADHKVEDGQINQTSTRAMPDGKELDQSVLNEKEAKRKDVSQSDDAQTVQKALKSCYSSPFTVDQDLKKGFEKINVLNFIRAHYGNEEPRY